MSEKKKVLIISYYWPPSGGAGVQRWLKFAKYLPNFNWIPVIYTPSNPESPADDESLLKEIHPETIVVKKPIWEPYSWYKKIIGQNKNQRVNAGFLAESEKPKKLERISVWIRGNLFIPDARKFWIKPSVRFLHKYLKENNIDTIISSGPPHSMHVIALKVKQKLNVKWIADFRDPWTNIDYYKDLLLTNRSDKKQKKLERDVLLNADCVITVGETMAQEFRHIGASKVELITNGYDAEDIPELKPKLDEKFSIVHVGAINKDRNHPIFVKALNELVSKNPELKNDLEIKLIGKVDHSVIEEIKKYNLLDNLKQVDYISHNKVLIELMKARLLYLPINNSPNAKGIVTGKVFEYLASQRPILTIGPTDGDMAAILKETKAGEIFDFEDFENVHAFIYKKYMIFKKNEEDFNSNESSIFSRAELTKKLSLLLNQLQEIND